MGYEAPYDLLVACKACGIENLLRGFSPNEPALCNQCRDRLLEPNLHETHYEYECQDCGARMLLTQGTEFTLGESACLCGSSEIRQNETSRTLGEVTKAGMYDEKDSPDSGSDGFDWCRSEPGAAQDEEYNEMFDKDLGGS